MSERSDKEKFIKDSILTKPNCERIHEYFGIMMVRDYYARAHGSLLDLRVGNVAESLLSYAVDLGATSSDIEYLAKHYGFEKTKKGYKEGTIVENARKRLKKSYEESIVPF